MSERGREAGASRGRRGPKAKGEDLVQAEAQAQAQAGARKQTDIVPSSSPLLVISTDSVIPFVLLFTPHTHSPPPRTPSCLLIRLSSLSSRLSAPTTERVSRGEGLPAKVGHSRDLAMSDGQGKREERAMERAQRRSCSKLEEGTEA